MYRRVSTIQGLDWWTIGMFLLLVTFGWMNIYGATYSFEQTEALTFDSNAGKQLLWIATACFMGIVLLIIDSKVYDTFAYILYGAWLLILLITPIFAKDINGSLSWLSLGPVSLQPAEFAKCFTALAIAKYMSRYEYRLRDMKDLLVPCIILGLPIFIIMILQRETGSALVFLAFAFMLYREGMSGYILLIGAAAILFFIIAIRFSVTPLPIGTGTVGILVCMLLILAIEFFFLLQQKDKKYAYILLGGIGLSYTAGLITNIWIPVNFNLVSIITVGASILYLGWLAFYWRTKELFILFLFAFLSTGYCFACDFAFNRILQPHQRIRIEVLFGMKEDPYGAGYNINQSKIAIGSGGLTGKGFLQGTQTKLKYIPEQHTDFIFCTVGEEWGFIGSTAVLLLYLAFILRIIHLAERQKDKFSQIYAYCVASIFLFHLTINVGMVIGLLPVIGIPLPFFSYGGSSLWGFTLLLFILLKLDASRLEKMR